MATQFKSAVYTSAGVKDTIVLDWMKPMNNPATIVVAITNTPTMTVNVEGTLDDPASATATWFSVPSGNALSASATIQLQTSWRAVRLNVSSWTAGNVQWWVLQGDGDQ